ncbi:coilin isoform 2-T2 [Trichechus inunguis]
MAAPETVRLRLQFDYPPPVTPDCTVFWLLVDLSRCRVVTDLISLVRQRFGFSSGAFLGLYLDGGLLPPGESARLVRDNDCLRNNEYQKQQQLNEVITNSSTVIQNPVEIHKKDYSMLPQLAAAPQVGEKIAFKLLELTSDYSPDVSDYKEGKILSHNPETQQVDIEILSSLPAVKEPGKFDLVYHNENGTEVVEYAVTQEKRITVFWRELIDPRLIVESASNTSSTELA